jgi:hypothetical protein
VMLVEIGDDGSDTFVVIHGRILDRLRLSLPPVSCRDPQPPC